MIYSMSSIPVPPPPPPILFNHPNRSLKPLFWKRLQFTETKFHTVHDVVWKEIETQPLLNSEDFQQLFRLRSSAPTDGRSRHIAGRESTAVRLLDRRKSQAIEIFLKGMHVECDELQDALLNLDTSVVDTTTVAALCDMMPTTDELDTIHTYLEKHPNCSLDGPEMFLYQLSLVDCLQERAQCFIIQAQFREQLGILRQHIYTLQQASQSLFRNPQLNKVLGVILAVGNLMNKGNPVRGEANGFQIDILNRLKDVRSVDGSNLLQYIVKCYCILDKPQSQASMLCGSNPTFPLPCYTLLSAASGISFEDLKHDLFLLKHNLTECESRFKTFDTSKKSGKNFKQKMKSFLTNANYELEGCQKWMDTVKDSFYIVVEYYCAQLVEPEDNETSPKQFFSMWIQFLREFKELWEKEQKVLARQSLEKLQTTKMAAAQLKPLSESGLKAKLRNKVKNN